MDDVCKAFSKRNKQHSPSLHPEMNPMLDLSWGDIPLRHKGSAVSLPGNIHRGHTADEVKHVEPHEVAQVVVPGHADGQVEGGVHRVKGGDEHAPPQGEAVEGVDGPIVVQICGRCAAGMTRQSANRPVSCAAAYADGA